jgi:protein-S-isoprenylcysteine O-methyltransferase Ste14
MPLGLLAAVLLVCVWAAVFVFRSEAVLASLQAYTGAERLWVFLTPAVLSLHFTLVCVTLSLDVAPPPARLGAGGLVFGSGIGLWFWGRAAIGPLRARRHPEDPPLAFRRDGPFRIVRNPMALGMVVAAGGALVAAPTPWSLATCAASGLCLAVRTGQEERRMRAHVGDAYDAYCRTVRRLIPFVW